MVVFEQHFEGDSRVLMCLMTSLLKHITVMGASAKGRESLLLDTEGLKRVGTMTVLKAIMLIRTFIKKSTSVLWIEYAEIFPHISPGQTEHLIIAVRRSSSLVRRHDYHRRVPSWS